MWDKVPQMFFYDLINFLKNEDLLDIESDIDNWVLRYVFVPRIKHKTLVSC